MVKSDCQLTNLIYSQNARSFEETLKFCKAKAINSRNEDGTTPLMVACSLNKPEIVDLLLEYGAKVDKVTKYEGWTALLIAAKAKLYYCTKYLIAHGADVNHQSNSGTTALKLAVGHVPVLKLLVDHGALVNLCDFKGISPLFHSVLLGCIDSVKFLLENGANTDEKELYQGLSPLLALILRDEEESKEDVEIAKLLIKHGADVNTSTCFWSALSLACHVNKPHICSVLVGAGADVNFIGDLGETAMTWAIENENLNIIQQLIRSKVHLNYVDYDGYSYLMRAVAKRNMAMVTLLLKNDKQLSVDFSPEDCQDLTALMISAANGDTDIMQMLINRGFTPDDSSVSGNSPLLLATTYQHTTAAKQLCAKGADVNKQNVLGITPLMMAALTNNLSLFQHFLNKQKANLYLSDYSGNLVGHYAAVGGKTKLISELIGQDKDILDSRNFLGHNCLMSAIIAKNNLRVIKLLLDHGVQVNRKEIKSGKSALDFASEQKNEKVVRLLRSFGAESDKASCSIM